MASSASVGLVLAVALLAGVNAGPVKVSLDCKLEDMVDPVFTDVAVGSLITENPTTTDNCVSTCLQTGYLYGAMSEGIHCLCSNDDVAVPAMTAGDNCELLCDVDACGSELDITKLSVYETGGGSPNFTLVATVDEGTSVISLAVVPLSTGTTFLIDFGYGAPLSYFNDTTAMQSVPIYLVPGQYAVTVIGIMEGTPFSYFLSENLTKTGGVASVDLLECPIVWEPDIEYYCNVSVTPVDGTTVFQAVFDDNSDTFNIQGLGADFYRLGNPPPRGLTSDVLPPASATNVILLKDQPVTIEAELIAFDMYAYSAGDFTVSMKRPTCASGVYCVHVRGCMAECPFSIIQNAHTCAAPQLFCALRRTCSDASDVCLAFEAPVTSWDDVPGSDAAGSFAAVGYHRELLAAPVVLLPGDVIHVTGPVGQLSTGGSGGDEVDGATTTSHHYVTAILKENIPVQVSHICTTVNVDVNLDVTLTSDASVLLNNHTSCERNITDIAMKVNQADTDAYNISLNLVDPFYIRTITPAIFTAIFSVAGPVTFTYTYEPSHGVNHSFVDITDYPLIDVPYEVAHTVDILPEGVYTVTISAENQHNLIPGPMTNQVTVFAQHEVVTTWTVIANAPLEAFKIPAEAAQFKFEDTAAANFPTNASARCDWGDGTPLEVLPFVNPGDNLPILQHVYTKGGEYTITVYIYNMVSGYEVTCDVLIVEEVKDFVITNQYFPTLTSTESRNGFGRTRNQYPMDKNLTFFPTMSQGTVDEYVVEFSNNNSQIFTFKPVDRFIPTADYFNYHFDLETFLNLTVYAVNIFERVPVELFVEIVGLVKIVQINDFGFVTAKDEMKTIEVSYESLGGGTCIVISWGDTGLRDLYSFGEEITCKANFSYAIYNPEPLLDIANNFTHNYTANGVYNISVMAYNPVSVTKDMLMFIVSDVKCRPPAVEIPGGTLDYLAAPKFYRADNNPVTSVATLNCEVTSKTKKRWQIYSVDSVWGNIMNPVLTMDIVETWNMSEIIIPERYLVYGHYMLTYTITMFDEEVLDLDVPFQSQIDTYFEIIRTPLIPMIFVGGLSRVTRGPDQEVAFQPAKYSIDPDYPDQKNFTIAWRCREVGEEWPADDTTANPIWPKGTSGTGCFGYGPGLLDYSEGNLTVFGSDFAALGKIYEMEAIITKDIRTATAMGQVDVITENPPIIEVKCLADGTCSSHGGGVYINPSLKIAVVSECVDFCVEPMTIKWVAKDLDGNTFLTSDTAHFPVGDTESGIAMVTQFFDDNYELSDISLAVEYTDPNGVVGGALYFMKVNRRPIDGYCSMIEPPTRLSLVDTYKIQCGGWVDPENKGISVLNVFSVDADGVETPLVNVKYTSATPVISDLIMPPGTFDIIVYVTDVWDAYTIHTAITGMEVLMPTQEQLEAADINGLIAELSGAGNTPLLLMLLGAQQQVMAEADWLSLSPEDLEGLSQEELDARLILLANMNNDALDAIIANVNFNTLGSINTAGSVVAGIAATASSLETYKIIDIDARGKIAIITEKMLGGVQGLEIPSSDQLIPLVNYIATTAVGMALGQKEVGSNDDCQNAPPSDFVKAWKLPFNTEVTGLDMVIPEDPNDIKKCNVRDVTNDRAGTLVPLFDSVLNTVIEDLLLKMITGEKYEVVTTNDVNIKIDKVTKIDPINFETSGGGFIFPKKFDKMLGVEGPISRNAQDWPFNPFDFPDSSRNLAKGTRVLVLIVYDKNMKRIVVEHLEEDVVVIIPRTIGMMGENTLPEFEHVNGTKESAKQMIPTVYTNFNITKDCASANLEILPDKESPRLFVMVSKPRLPTLKQHEYFKLVKDIPIENGVHNWLFRPTDLNGTGRYFVGVGEFEPGFDTNLMSDPQGNNVTLAVLQNISTNYMIRIYTSGCYYFNEEEQEWQCNGMQVQSSSYNLTLCETSHLTCFGAGMFIMPNTIDFNYVFANMGFTDNLTIYLTLIICLTIFVLLLIWARIKDRKDVEKLGASPLPDNRVEDKYFYEMLVFTGNLKGAQTDSTVQFILTGEEDETDVRTLGDSSRKILRKADVDVFVLAVPRPLGPLQFLRIWHDNSGKGVNASWFLSFIVFRDVQTGDKYEFIANQWLAVEHDDGMIDRLIPVASKEQKTQFKHLFNATKNKNLADGHLWFSVFLRPPRSRFTRCQRVGSCFALLFLSMLVNAMWYDQVPEQPGTGGLSLGPFSLSPEQIGVGVMSNLIVFPPSFLIVFLFRKSRPRTLRRSRIEEAVEKTRAEQGAVKVEPEKPDGKKKVIIKKRKNKKFTLPWWFKLVAWLLVLACIVVSCFFLLMYGIMFGNSKATKWVTSLIISFFSSVLFVQPIKIFLTALLVSVIFKSVDLDEDDADEDEDDPNLDQDEAWLHDGKKREKNYKQRKIDSETLLKLRKARKKELEMWSIIKEIFFYGFFLWILLILSYGNRDPNAYLMVKNLRSNFLHEGALDGTDYTKVSTTDKLWKYLFDGLMPDLRADVLYNGHPPYGLRGFLNDWCNRILGYATVRQIRIQEHTCRVPTAMQAMTINCSSFSSIAFEESKHYCAGWVLPTEDTKDSPECNVPEFRYESAGDLHSLPIWGQRDWYGGGGYVLHLKESTADVYKKMRELQENRWIDSMTRAVIIEFSSYNSQVNLFGTSLIMAEFTPGGGVTPSYRFDGIRLLQHHDNFGFFIICCEFIFVGFVVYYTVHEIRLFYKQRRRYFDTYWSYAEIALIIASYTALTVYFLRFFATKSVLDTFSRTRGNGYVKLQYAASLDEMFGYVVGFIVFVGTLKFTKLLRFNKRIGILSATLHQCWDDLSGFLMAFFLCFFSFVIMFFVLLNMYLEGFYNFVTAVETCFSMMLGKFQFEEMKQVSMMVPIMFFVFVLCNSWVLINLLLTLIIKSFQKVKHDIMRQPNEYEMVAFVWGRFKGFLGMDTSTQTAGTLQTTVKTKQEETQDDKVQQLPDKVDKFLDYLNSVYFSGSLDVNNRDALKSSFYRSQMSRKATGIMEANSRNPDNRLGRAKNPASAWNDSKRWNSARNNVDGNDAWRGAHDGGKSAALASRGKGGRDNTSNDSGPVYDGPRVSNKFQAELDDI